MTQSLWNVPDNFWVLQRRSRWARTLYLSMHGEPERKGRRGKRSSVAFQQQVLDQLMTRRRRPFTGPVALDLQFYTRRRNPPAIHQLAKHVLDLLGAADAAVQPRWRSVLYRDDRQVKFLYVGLHQGWDPEAADGETPGWSTIVARPVRDVASDLQLAQRLSHDDWDAKEDESSPFYSPELRDELDRALDLPTGDRASWSWVDEFSVYFDAMQTQTAVLARTDAALLTGLCSYLDSLSDTAARRLEEWREAFEALLRDSYMMSRHLLLSNPLTAALPALPRATGDATAFTRALREQLEGFRARHPLFTSLVVPVKVTFLVVPPEQGKDLDNVARVALPVVHDVLRPHIEPHLLSPQPPDEEPKPWREEALRRLRSLNANSVAAYQVIELPRTPHDPPEGVLRLALGSAHSYRSWWDQAAAYVDERINDADGLFG
ncbi:RusA family crossover junction endodeoxyribonuclease [Microbispora cellulosiformans]|uniref:RusA family crossover junction endodeoxyribonuclease n=1 Tax=Microbispora cellulosiformans TaxID=2614688 RepID=A0A5J5K4X9_9ACTN|nr:RusA family crossover junction endodeoxyribonuclease [Microbispora cellulosiformans]KAA9379651.1 RusA family crossover junction endodeoxyribonuclease [Microbispora cellulosiformans]